MNLKLERQYQFTPTVQVSISPPSTPSTTEAAVGVAPGMATPSFRSIVS